MTHKRGRFRRKLLWPQTPSLESLLNFFNLNWSSWKSWIINFAQKMVGFLNQREILLPRRNWIFQFLLSDARESKRKKNVIPTWLRRIFIVRWIVSLIFAPFATLLIAANEEKMVIEEQHKKGGIFLLVIFIILGFLLDRVGSTPIGTIEPVSAVFIFVLVSVAGQHAAGSSADNGVIGSCGCCCRGGRCSSWRSCWPSAPAHFWFSQ